MTIKYLSVCSGIEAATVAWHGLGWQPVAFSEIEAFPSAVLAHHYPDVPNLGDMTKHKEWNIDKIDLLVGGTPCQSFSVAGLRKGLDDPRGNLMLTFLAIAERQRPKYIVWENVPGVLSSNRGRDFGTFLGALGQLGYGWAYRVLDAQWFGVAQRRRRVFVVGCLGNPSGAAAILFKHESVQRHPAPSREKRQDAAADAGSGAEGNSRVASTFVPNQTIPINSMNALRSPEADPSTGCGIGDKGEAMFTLSKAHHHAVAYAIQGAATRENLNSGPDGVGVRGDDCAYTLEARSEVQAVAFSSNMSAPDCRTDGTTPTLKLGGQGGNNPPAVAMNIYGGNKRPDRPEGGFYVREEDTSKTLDAASGLNPTCSQGGTAVVTTQYGDIAGSLTARHDSSPCADRGQNVIAALEVAGTLKACKESGGWSNSADHAAAGYMVPTASMQVRRLTPVECERLQGFPDNYTNIPWRKKPEAPDGPRYKALGNSMAVPVMRWIGERIAESESEGL